MAISAPGLWSRIAAASAAGTGGYVYLRGASRNRGPVRRTEAAVPGSPAAKRKASGHPRVRGLLERRFGLILDAAACRIGRDGARRALLDQKPQFLWPSSSVLVEVARNSGLKISRDQVIFNSPSCSIRGTASPMASLKAALPSLPAGRATRSICSSCSRRSSPAKPGGMGVTGLFGRARVVSTDPDNPIPASCSPALPPACSAATDRADSLSRIDGDVATVFRRMGYKPHHRANCSTITSPAAPAPAADRRLREPVDRVGAAGRRPLEAGRGSAPSKPVILYPRPTVSRRTLDQHRPRRRRTDRCARQREPARTRPGRSTDFADRSARRKARNPLLQSRRSSGSTPCSRCPMRRSCWPCSSGWRRPDAAAPCAWAVTPRPFWLDAELDLQRGAPRITPLY